MEESKRFDLSYLQNRANSLAQELQIEPHIWMQFIERLSILNAHHGGSFMHCLRVGIYAHGIAVRENFPDKKLPFLGGCAHDIGKCEVATEILDAGSLTSEQLAEIHKHPRAGYDLLKDKFLYSAIVAGLHHKLQASGYGIDIDIDPPFPLPQAAKDQIIRAVRIVMISDFFDAMTTRGNQRGLFFDPESPMEQEGVMLRYFGDQRERIKWLVANRIR